MRRLAEICIERPIFASMMTLALLVVGGVSYFRLGVDRLPSVDLPTVRIQATLPGAAPEEIETEVSDQLEEAVNTVEGIDNLRSISGSGSAVVIATFNLNREIDSAAQDVRDRVSTAQRNLPDDTQPPQVSKVDNDSEPVMTIALSGERSVKELTEIADKTVRSQLERSQGVGEIRLNGDLARTINLWIDAEKLIKYGIPITAVRDAVVAQNADVPGGNVTSQEQERTLRTAGRFRSAEEFSNLTVTSINGAPIRIRDLGRAEDGVAEQRRLARLNGKPTVVLEIVRQSGANTIAVIEGIKANLVTLRAQMPPDIKLEVIRDQSNYIYAALHEINLHLILGSILASLVVLVFMRNWRSTIIAAVAIPTSVVATFGVMWALNFTLNSVTMLALVLMVGIVIDDAIVVLENIFRFIEEKQLSPREAAKQATGEIALAVLATTLSLVVIFVPVSFMSSISGRFLYQFGITASVSVLVSLFISFTLTPMMASRLLRREEHGGGHGAAASRQGFYARIDQWYERMLRYSLEHRTFVSIIAVVIVVSSVPAYYLVKQEFVPADVDEAEFSVNVTAPEGTSIGAMDQAMSAVDEEVRSIRGVKDVLLTSGGGFLGQVNSGNLYVRIAPHEERVFSLSRLLYETVTLTPWRAFQGNYSQSDVMTEIDKRLKRFRDLRIQVRNFPSFNIGSGPFEIDFVIRGPDLERLYHFGETLRHKAIAAGGFRGLDTSLRIDKPELRVEIDRERAADLGVDANDIGTALRLMVGGDEELSRFLDPTTNEDYDVRLRLSEESRNDPALIDQLYLPRRTGSLVQLSSVASVVPVKAASRIDRLDRQRMISVRGSVEPGYALADRIEVLREIVKGMNLPAEYSTVLLGRSRELERTFSEFVIAFVLSIVFMYLILASQFESLVHPLTILISLPLSIPFALFSLWATGGTLNLYSALGILVLFGVVKKNAILQIDHTNSLRASGMSRFDAIMQGNRDRLRPILMTTLALVAGMLPLAVGTGAGAEERRAVAVVVIGGQTLCLLFTLLVTPVAYSLFDDLSQRFSRRASGRDLRPASQK